MGKALARGTVKIIDRCIVDTVTEQFKPSERAECVGRLTTNTHTDLYFSDKEQAGSMMHRTIKYQRAFHLGDNVL